MPLPDLIEIVPLDRPVRAEITVPGSKSITNRALILAALADGEVALEGALWSEDTQVMVEALRKLGFEINVEPDPQEFCNRTITVRGLGGKVPSAGTEEKPLELFVGNAGTAARFLAAMVCLGNGVYRLSGVPRMHERPQAALFAGLRQLGYRVEAEGNNEKLPARIFGGSPAPLPLPEGEGGRRPGGGEGERSCTVSIEESSQFASALMLCAKHGGWNVKVVGENAEESPYVAMTGRLIEAFPSRGGKFQIEPDASSGSYFWAAADYEPAGAKETRSRKGRVHLTMCSYRPSVCVKCWPRSGWQADEKFPEHMWTLADCSPAFGVHSEEDFAWKVGIDWRNKLNEVWPDGYADISISRQCDLGDGIMTAIALSPLAAQPVKFADLGRLRLQECERVVALRTELTKCGAKVIEEGDTLTVYPSKVHGAEIETYNDHRMAMCFTILGLKVPGIRIKNPACVKKTFPNFFQKLAASPPKGLGATILDARTGRKLGMEELFAD